MAVMSLTSCNYKATRFVANLIVLSRKLLIRRPNASSRAPDRQGGQFWHKQNGKPLLIVLSLLFFSVPCIAYPARTWTSITPPFLQSDAQQRIATEKAFLLAHRRYLEARLQQAQPLIRHIAREIDRRRLPSILILLPFIESGYRLDVVSSAGAAGLWQLMPDTARRYGVPVATGFDGRYSLPHATAAALTYLTWLNQKFGGDWLLTLAAYNAGEGRIQRAQEESKELSYWRLPLANETRRYVPRLLALAELLQHPEHYGLQLPDWNSGDELTIRRYPAPLSLAALASAARIPEARLAALNPALRQSQLNSQGEYLLLVPTAKAEVMAKAAGKLGLEMGAVAPLLLLDTLNDPLLLAGSKGVDFERRPHLSNQDAGDPLGLKTKRQPLIDAGARPRH